MPTSTDFTGSSLLEDESVVLKDYLIGHHLGEGAYGSVYVATYIPSGEKFALKILPITNIRGHEEKIIQEATVMQSLEHPHVVKLYKFLRSTTSFYFLLELADGGELFDLIISVKHFNETTARRYFQQLMSAVDYCLSHGVAHRDLKAENMLLSKDQKLLVCDFGFSKKAGPDEAQGLDGDMTEGLINAFGTLHYTSPEALAHFYNNTALDIFQQDLWSAGVLLFFMLTGRLPFDGLNEEETIYLIQRGLFSFSAEEGQRLSTEVQSLLIRMLAVEPTERPTLAQIIKDPWFQEDLDVTLFPHHALNNHSIFLDFSIQHHATEEEKAVIDKAFRIINIDGYKELTHDQIRDILTTLRGKLVSEDEVDELMKLFTGNSKSSSITYKQFHDAWICKDLAHCEFKRNNDFQLTKIVRTPVNEVEHEVVREIRTAFNSVDDSHTGCIDVAKWQRLFKRCNIIVSDKEICSLMRFFIESEMEQDGEITFGKFLFGILNREMLVRHPMGRKLAAATNLAELLQSQGVVECVQHGLLVAGLQCDVIKKLSTCPEKLRFVHNNAIASDTEKVYTFRYFGSAALASRKNSETATPMFKFTASPKLGTKAVGYPSSTPEDCGMSPSINHVGTFPSLLKSQQNIYVNGAQANNASMCASSLAHRMSIYGGASTVGKINGVCDVDVILSSDGLGYTLVRLRRICGDTKDFHEGVSFIWSRLEKERQQAMEDTLPRGESELI